MKNSDRSQNTLNTDWQTLGELELPTGIESDPAIRSWLVEILAPLDLHVEFLNKVSKSAWQAATRAMQAEPVIKFEHIRLLIFAPKRLGSKGQTWGFFRIERIDQVGGGIDPDHRVEFYLYLEGQ